MYYVIFDRYSIGLERIMFLENGKVFAKFAAGAHFRRLTRRRIAWRWSSIRTRPYSWMVSMPSGARIAAVFSRPPITSTSSNHLRIQISIHPACSVITPSSRQTKTLLSSSLTSSSSAVSDDYLLLLPFSPSRDGIIAGIFIKSL